MLLYAPLLDKEAPGFPLKQRLNLNYDTKESIMSNALKRARPVVEATVVSVALIVAALSVPAAIVLSSV